MSRKLRISPILLLLVLLALPAPVLAAGRSATSVRVTWRSHDSPHHAAPARFDRGRRLRWERHDRERFDHRRRRGYDGRQELRRSYAAERRMVAAPLPLPVPRILLPPPLIIGHFRFW